ncbi:PQQ-binding-like beta-propeller repeat protein [Kitasatospora misakiensis]|uniref:PQQ-binding-like beta-propeller repeat protein n=1 Tax=Kitasatospora misakiensis TaxID=67330 RepID=A0ABW0WUD1_9ACTN
MNEPEHLTVRSVLGGGPFAEIGEPCAVVRDDARGLVAVGGSVGDLYGTGRSVGGWHGDRVGVYEVGGLHCRLVVRTRWPVLGLAFHPHLPLLAIGTGAYDGGYFHEGELLLVDLADGTTVSALQDRREVRRVGWREDGRALEVVVAPADDEADDSPETHGFAAVVERDDWGRVAPRSVSWTELSGPRVEAPHRPKGVKRAAREAVAALAAGLGLSWSPRCQVWAVEELADGRMLAVLAGTKLECRLPSGVVEWTVPDPDGARELHVSPGRTSAWIHVPRPNRWVDGAGWKDVPSTVERLSLDDGSTLDSVEIAFPAALTAGLDGRIALRDTRADKRKTPMVLLAPDGTPTAGPALGGYDSTNTYFAVRHSPELLFLQGGKKKYWQDKWVVAVDPAATSGGGGPTVRRLFPLEWDADRAGHLYGGPPVHLAGRDGSDPALVHAGAVHHGHGPQPGGVFVARRRLPDGHPQWVFTADDQVTALDSDPEGGTVFAAFTSGELVALDAADGAPRWRTRLLVDGVPTTALSLVAPAAGRLLVGTVDGRVLVCEHR